MSRFKADALGTPTEQVRAAVGWEPRAAIVGGLVSGRTRVRRERACTDCAAVNIFRSRTGTWCDRHQFATEDQATCRSWIMSPITITED